MSICKNRLVCFADFGTIVQLEDFFMNEIKGIWNLTGFCLDYFMHEDIEINVLDKNTYFGTSWIDVISTEMNDANELIVHFESSWSPPKKFVDELTTYFSCSAKLEYSEPVSNKGGIYETCQGTVTSDYEMSYYEYYYRFKGDSSVLDYLLEYCVDEEELNILLDNFKFDVYEDDKESLRKRLKELKNRVDDN